MSEIAVEEKTMQSEELEPVQAQTTAGTLLRQAREAARMQLPVMAATLKVPQHKLEALEADDYAAFPDHVFMRALAMSMCRSLHIDTEPVLALLPHREIKSLAGQGAGINEAVKVRSNFKGAGTPLDSGSNGTRKIVAGVLVLLAAAAAVYFVPFHQASDGAEEVTQAMTPEQALPGNTVETAALVTEPVVPANQGTETTDVAVGSVTEASEAVTGAVAASSVAQPEAAAPAPIAPAPAAEATASADVAAGLLVLKVNTGQSWVKVKDGAGKVVLEKTLNKDESATAEGQLPLSVIVGNAKGTQVTVRGEPFDISTTRDNVARFEVK